MFDAIHSKWWISLIHHKIGIQNRIIFSTVDLIKWKKRACSLSLSEVLIKRWHAVVLRQQWKTHNNNSSHNVTSNRITFWPNINNKKANRRQTDWCLCAAKKPKESPILFILIAPLIEHIASWASPMSSSFSHYFHVGFFPRFQVFI